MKPKGGTWCGLGLDCTVLYMAWTVLYCTVHDDAFCLHLGLHEHSAHEVRQRVLQCGSAGVRECGSARVNKGVREWKREWGRGWVGEEVNKCSEWVIEWISEWICKWVIQGVGGWVSGYSNSTVLIQYGLVHYCIVLYCTVLYNSVYYQYNTTQHCTVQYHYYSKSPPMPLLQYSTTITVRALACHYYSALPLLQ